MAPEGYREWLRGKTRIAIAWGFVALLAIVARSYPTTPGIILCFLGATIRYWSSGYLRKDQRPAVGGPYAYTRNPLYLGTYLMAVGVAWAIENWILLGAVSILFAAVYHYIILDEETKLKEIFGAPYERYKELVPRFFPRVFPPARDALEEVNPEPTHYSFSKELGRKNKAYEAYVTFVALIAVIVLSAFLWNL